MNSREMYAAMVAQSGPENARADADVTNPRSGSRFQGSGVAGASSGDVVAVSRLGRTCPTSMPHPDNGHSPAPEVPKGPNAYALRIARQELDHSLADQDAARTPEDIDHFAERVAYWGEEVGRQERRAAA